MGKRINIGKTVSQPGTITKGWVDVDETSSAMVRFPFVVINGFKDGPTLGITSGCHPTEWAGIEANLRIIQKIKPEDLSGAILSVPCVNTPGFEVRQYTTPQDGLNVATQCPGDPHGTMTQRITYKLFEQIMPHLDYEIDLHGGGFHTLEVFPNAVVKIIDDERIMEASKQLVKWFGYEYYFLATRGAPGRRSIIGEAISRGIPAAVFETGRSYMVKEDSVQRFIKGLTSVMKGLKMIAGQPDPPNDLKEIPMVTTLRAQRGGTFTVKVQVGELCREGQLLGVITSLLGDVVEEVKAPADGIIYLIIHKYNVSAGDLLFFYGLWEGEPGPVTFEQGLVR